MNQVIILSSDNLPCPRINLEHPTNQRDPLKKAHVFPKGSLFLVGSSDFSEVNMKGAAAERFDPRMNNRITARLDSYVRRT